MDTCIRRTASLDGLYMRPLYCVGPSFTILQLDKSTQTDESCLDRSKGGGGGEQIDAPTDIKIEKVIRQRLQRTQRGENSVSSQTLSPMHHGMVYRLCLFIFVRNFDVFFCLQLKQVLYKYQPDHVPMVDQ